MKPNPRSRRITSTVIAFVLMITFKRTRCFVVLAVALSTVVGCAGRDHAAPGQTNQAPRPFQGERVCLSLRALADVAAGAKAAGKPLPPEAFQLGGIGFVEGYVADPEHGDIILVGQADATPMTLDDLVVHLRNIWSGGPPPYCSLDPRPADIVRMNKLLSTKHDGDTNSLHRLFSELRQTVGPQQVILGGERVPRDSGLSHAMIFADYEMKKASQGHLQLPGVPSMLDLSLGESQRAIEQGRRAAAAGLASSRFWFCVESGHPTFTEGGGMVRIQDCAVMVLTESQVASRDGRLRDGGPQDPLAQVWAAAFSRSLPDVAQQAPQIAQLLQHYRLAALIRAMAYRDAAEKAGLPLDYFLQTHDYAAAVAMPRTLPGLANYAERSLEVPLKNSRAIWYFMPMVCGGVSMDLHIREHQFAGSGLLDTAARTLLRARPSIGTLCWKVVI